MTSPHWTDTNGATALLVPTDGSDPALRAVDQAIALAKVLVHPARLVLLNVQPELPGDVRMLVPEQDIRAYLKGEGERQLASALKRAQASGLEFETHVVSGPVVGSILEAAERYGCQATVIAGRGLGGISGVLLGSVANQVLQLSKRPVILVH